MKVTALSAVAQAEVDYGSTVTVYNSPPGPVGVTSIVYTSTLSKFPATVKRDAGAVADEESTIV